MADKKISALTAASTPLAGTEVLPIVQSGATVKATVANVTGAGAYPGHFTTVRSYRSGVDQSVQVSVSGGESFIAAVNGANSSEMPLYLQVQNTGLALTNVASVASTGLRVITGNLIIGTSGNGIDFSATPGTGTSELLADYEEGTWTPNQGSGLTVVGTFFSIGQYTKVGRLVTAFGYVAGTTSVAATANAELTSNLPFTVGPRTASGAVYATGATSAASTCNAGGASTILYIATTIAATTGQIYFNVTYEV
jgi:hypothetical protein